jgi:hypothetical protein
MGQWGITPRILNLGTGWKWSASRPGRFTPGGHPLCGPQYRSSYAVVKAKFLSVLGIKLLFLCYESHSVVNVRTD